MEGKRTLYRDTDNKMLGGVASGLAEYMGLDVTLVRLVFVLCLFAMQGSVLAYIVAWILIPTKGNAPKPLSFGLIILLLLICFLPMVLLFGWFFFISTDLIFG